MPEAIDGEQFFDTNRLTFTKLLDDPPHNADNLRAYIAGFSEWARDALERFGFETQISRLSKANLTKPLPKPFLAIPALRRSAVGVEWRCRMRNRMAMVLGLILLVARIPLTTAAQVTTPGGTFIDDRCNPHEPNIEGIAAVGITRA